MVHLQRRQNPHCFTSQMKRPNQLNMFLHPLYGCWTVLLYCIPWNMYQGQSVVWPVMSSSSWNRRRPMTGPGLTWSWISILMYPSRTQRVRERRGAGCNIQIAINHGNKKCPTQRKKYLSDGSNKANLASFLVQEWQKPEYFVRFADFGSLFVTHGMECHKLTAGENGIDCNGLDEMCTQQEEADTRIILHTSHDASNGHDCIAIKSPDTDVAVLACTFSYSINAKMLFCIDTKQRRRRPKHVRCHVVQSIYRWTHHKLQQKVLRRIHYQKGLQNNILKM